MTVEAFEAASPATIVIGASYDIPWPYMEGGVIAVVVNDGERIVLDPADYVVDPITSASDGTLTLTPAVAALHEGGSLIISRQTPIEQGWQGILGYRERGLERQLDATVMRVQELTAEMQTTVRADVPLRPGTPQPGRVLMWASDGASVEAGPTLDAIEGAQGYAEQAMQAAASASMFAPVYFETVTDMLASTRDYPPGALLTTRAEAMTYRVAAEMAVDHHAVTAGGAKLYEAGHRYTTRERWIAAITRGELASAPDGVGIVVNDQVLFRRADATTIPGLPGWDHPRSVHKSILTGDWQPRIDYPAERTALRAVMDDMQRYHGDADDMVHVGDITYRASQNATGDVAGVVSHRDILDDLYSRTAIARVYMIPGNHDSDGFGLTQHQYAWTQRQFLDYIGRRFYAVRMGNLLRVFMGTMTGDAGGMIHTTTLYWFDQVLKRNAGCNIEVYLHQPLYGYNGFAEDSQYVQYKAVSDRIVSSLNSVDNVAFVCSGHVARPEDLPNYYDAYGTRMFGVNMHVPRVSSDGEWEPTGPELPYGVLEYARGETSATVRIWDASTHSYISGRDIPVTYKYPLDLGGGVPDFDGRYASDASWPSFDGVVQIQRDLWEDRENIGTVEAPNWVSKAGFRPGLRMVLMETAVDNANAGDGLSIDWWVPASVTSPSATGENKSDLAGNYLAGRAGVRRETGAETDVTGQFAVQLGNGAGTLGALRDVLTVDGSTGMGYLPLGANPSTALATLGMILTTDLGNTLSDKGPLSSGANLNSVAEPGVYRIVDGTTAAAISNVPYTASGAVVIVVSAAAPASARPVAAAGQMQIYIARAVPDGPRVYIRVCNSGAWQPWRLIPHDGLSRTSISAAPEFRGQKAYVGSVIYEASGTSSTADWRQISN